MDLNIVCLIGRLTENANVSTTKNGGSMCNFNIEVERRTEGESDVLAIQYYGKNTDKIAPYMTKGRQVSIKGRLKVDSWDYNGKQYSKLIIIGEDIEVLGFKKDDRGEPTEGPEAQSYDNLRGPEAFDEGDIPF